MQQDPLKHGVFPLRIRITDHNGNNLPELIAQFLERISNTYDLQILSAPPETAEAMIAVPFPDKEKVRIDFNIFASEIEDTISTPSRCYFFMESAY